MDDYYIEFNRGTRIETEQKTEEKIERSRAIYALPPEYATEAEKKIDEMFDELFKRNMDRLDKERKT